MVHPSKCFWISANTVLAERVPFELMFHHEQCWCTVRRVVELPDDAQWCSDECCENPDCRLRHWSEEIPDLGHGCAEALRNTSYTYVKLEVGPLAVRCEGEGALGHDGWWATTQPLHISLAYLPLVSEITASTLQRKLNRVVQQYFSVRPLERPKALHICKTFYSRKLPNGQLSTNQWQDTKVNICELNWDSVWRRWEAGEVYDESRDEPSESDLDQMWRTWSGNHGQFVRHIAAAEAIHEKAQGQQPEHSLKRTYTYAASINAGLHALELKGAIESEIFDLAEYCLGLLRVNTVHKLPGFDKQLHTLQSSCALHLTWRVENDLREKPGYSLPDLGSSGRFQIISQDLVNRQSIVKWTSPDSWGIAFWPWDQMAGGTPAQREGGLQRLQRG